MLIGVVVLFVTGILTVSSSAKFDPEVVLGLWLFDEGSGKTAADSSGNKNHGKFVKNPRWVDGKFGKALSFDGQGSWLDLGSDDSLRIAGKDITVVAWIKTGNNDKQATVIGRTTVVGPWDGYAMEVGGNLANEKLGFWYGDGTYFDFSDAKVNDDKWHHVAAVFNSAQTGFYIDGKLDSKKASAGNVDLDSSEKKVPLDIT